MPLGGRRGCNRSGQRPEHEPEVASHPELEIAREEQGDWLDSDRRRPKTMREGPLSPQYEANRTEDLSIRLRLSCRSMLHLPISHDAPGNPVVDLPPES